MMAPPHKHCLAKVIVPFLLFAAPGWAQEQAKPAPPRSPEAALAVVAKHLSDHYALYLYESLTAQILFNEGILERPNSPSAPKAKDSLWALGIISDSILAEEEDGEYLNIEKVPEFFEDVVHRYLNASHYWPDREITKDTRREHLAVWYSIYLMRSEEHTSELQSLAYLVCRLLLEKKKKRTMTEHAAVPGTRTVCAAT